MLPFLQSERNVEIVSWYTWTVQNTKKYELGMEQDNFQE